MSLFGELRRCWGGSGLALLCLTPSGAAAAGPVDLAGLSSPILLQGTETTAYRDPAVAFDRGVFHLFYTYVQSDGEQRNVRMAVGVSVSSDLRHWTPARVLTALDPRLNFSSPGSVFRYGGGWCMCVSSYPRPNGETFGNQDARIWLMRSADLEQWPWARGRLTAGFVLDLHGDPAVGKYLMFFHGTGPDPEPKVFDTRACLGIAWSDDLLTWHWPGSH